MMEQGLHTDSIVKRHPLPAQRTLDPQLSSQTYYAPDRLTSGKYFL